MKKTYDRPLARHFGEDVHLGKSRCEIVAMLTLGIVSARAVNPANAACERGGCERGAGG